MEQFHAQIMPSITLKKNKPQHVYRKNVDNEKVTPTEGLEPSTTRLRVLRSTD